MTFVTPDNRNTRVLLPPQKLPLSQNKKKTKKSPHYYANLSGTFKSLWTLNRGLFTLKRFNLTVEFPSLGNSDHAFLSVSIGFPSNSKWDAIFRCTAYIIPEPIIILGLRLPLMNISLVNIWSSLIDLHDFQFWFFFLYQDNKTFSSIRKFRQTNNCCKKVLEAATLDYAHKTKELIISWLMWILGAS